MTHLGHYAQRYAPTQTQALKLAAVVVANARFT